MFGYEVAILEIYSILLLITNHFTGRRAAASEFSRYA